MLRQTPPLEATEAFIAAARAPSFRVAAAGMALSNSAFSRRIQSLEIFLGAPLFDRSGSRAVLTETGRRYLEAIQPAVDAIRRASADIRKPLRNSVKVALSHSLAVEWLLPRLGRAQRDFGINVDLTVSRERQTLRDQEVDLAIWGAIEPDLGGGELLVTLDAVPVAAPLLVDGRLPPVTIDELIGYPLLAVRNPPDFWRQWLYSAGFGGSIPEVETVCETNQLCYETASAGLGIALAVPLLANRYLEDGRLHACAAPSTPTGMAYWIHHANPSARRRPEIRLFVDWLKSEALSTKDRFTALTERIACYSDEAGDLILAPVATA